MSDFLKNTRFKFLQKIILKCLKKYGKIETTKKILEVIEIDHIHDDFCIDSKLEEPNTYELSKLENEKNNNHLEIICKDPIITKAKKD